MNERLPPLLYIVRCRFAEGCEDIAGRWLDWLGERHLAEVLAAGAISAEIFQMKEPPLQFEIHYRFASELDFAHYEQNHAPRLRADGLARFPLSLGLSYERRSGYLVYAQPAKLSL